MRSLLGTLLAIVTADVCASDSIGPELIEQMLQAYDRHSEIELPVLSAEEKQTLKGGASIVKLVDVARQDSDLNAIAVMGLQVVEAPRVLVWLATLGGTKPRDERFTHATLSQLSAGAYVGYQHIDLPWPIRDRHWIILSEKNTPLAATTGGTIWEHRWRLYDGGTSLLAEASTVSGLDQQILEKSVYLPANSGAWTMFEMGSNRTLVAAWFDFEFGGRIPAGLARGFTKRQMKDGLATIDYLTRRVHRIYDANPAIYDGDGISISRRQAQDAAQEWLLNQHAR